MSIKLQFTQKQINDIIYKYKRNMKMRHIAKLYNCSHGFISKLLKNNNIIKPQHEYVLEVQELICTTCNNIKSLSEFYPKKCKLGYRLICNLCKSINNKQYNNNNKDKIQKYHINNRDKRNIRKRERYNNDIIFKMTENIRNRVRSVLDGKNKSKSTIKLLGCSLEELKKYLQQTAINNDYTDFDIDNYSGHEYHIDHIRPCTSFNLEDPDEQAKCFHYTNLQILTAYENISKGDRY